MPVTGDDYRDGEAGCVAVPDAVDETREERRDDQRQQQSDRHRGEHDDAAGLEVLPHHLPARGAERGSNRGRAAALVHDERDHEIQPNRRQAGRRRSRGTTPGR